jgi:excisionase family DNA binding protein
MKPLISIRQFAKATGLNYKLARRLVLSGDVPSKQIGRRRRISTRWLERWLEDTIAITQEEARAKMSAPTEAPGRV